MFRKIIILTLLTLFIVNIVTAQSDFLLSPAAGEVVTEYQPAFEWQTVSGATSYKLIVRTADRSSAYKMTISPSMCGATCVYTPTDALWMLRNNAGYEWFVKAKLSDSKVKAPKRSFNTLFPTLNAPTLISPIDKSRTADSQQTFSWTNANADEYVVKITDASVLDFLNLKKALPASVCSGNTCSVTAAELGLSFPYESGYVWKVIAKLPGQKMSSAKAYFLYNPTSDSYAQELLDLVNAERCAEGLVPLVLNDKLMIAANKHSLDMIVNDFFGHESSDGSSVADRVGAEQYDWTSVGENIALGYSDIQGAFDGWMNSTTGHRENILRANFREMGFAYVVDGSPYYTQVFGSSSTTALATCP